MDFSVGQILVDINNQPFRDILWSGLWGAIIGAGISSGFMLFVDNQNKKRWLTEVVTKHYVTDLVEAIQLTLETSNIVNSILTNIENHGGIYFHRNSYYKMNLLYKKLDEINTLTTDKLNKYMIIQNNSLLHFKHNVFFVELFFRDLYFLCWSNFSDFKKYRDDLSAINKNMEVKNMEVSNEFTKINCNNDFIHILEKIRNKHIQEKIIKDQYSILIVDSVEKLTEYLHEYLTEAKNAIDIMYKILKNKKIEKYIEE